MAEKTETPTADDGASELRGTLVKRLAIAGVLVAILLGVLAFFDYLSTPPDESESTVFTQPVPVAPKKEVSQPVKPTENLPGPPTASKKEEEAEAPPPPKVAAEPPKAPTASKPAASDPEKRPATPTPSPAAAPKALPAVVPQATAPVEAHPPRPTPEGTAAPTVKPEEAPPTLKPVARPVEAHPAEARPAPSPAQRLFSGFLLQAGVFSSIQRAEELHAKLTLSGVPSTLETRVQVGPFKTRQEAEAAQAKLKELGIEAILVPPRGARP